MEEQSDVLLHALREHGRRALQDGGKVLADDNPSPESPGSQ